MSVFIIYLLVINILTYYVYAKDKRKAERQEWRTPEAVLLTLAGVGGSAGALCSMFYYRHKTQHKLFVITVPVLFVLHTVCVVCLLVMYYPFSNLRIY